MTRRLATRSSRNYRLQPTHTAEVVLSQTDPAVVQRLHYKASERTYAVDLHRIGLDRHWYGAVAHQHLHSHGRQHQDDFECSRGPVRLRVAVKGIRSVDHRCELSGAALTN